MPPGDLPSRCVAIAMTAAITAVFTTAAVVAAHGSAVVAEERERRQAATAAAPGLAGLDSGVSTSRPGEPAFGLLPGPPTLHPG